MPAAMLIAAFTALLASAAAAGEAETAAAGSAATIVVSGRPLPQGIGAAPFAGLTLDAAALAPASGRPEDALRGVAGVQLFRRASGRTANPTAEGLTARGLSGNAASRMPLLLDGIPQADPFFGSVVWTALGSRPIASARVERGSGDVALGPGAVAGSVRMETMLDGSAFQARAGSRGSGELGFLASAPVATGALSLAARHSRGNGHLLVAPDRAGAADRPARYRQTGASLRAVVPFGTDTEVQGVLAAFDDRRLRGAEGADIAASGADIGARLVHRGAWPLEAAAWAQIRDFATRTVSFAADRATAPVTLDQRATPALGLGARIELRPPMPEPIGLRLGADARHASGETREHFRYVAGVATRTRRAGGVQDGAGAFAELGIAQGPLQAALGGRFDRWWLAEGRLSEIDRATGRTTLSQAPPDRTGSAWSGRAGLAWNPTPAITLAGHAGRAIRLPTLNELHRPFRVGNSFTDANPALDPERATSLGLTMRYQPLAAASLAATLFQTHLAGAIANVTLGEGPGVFPSVGFLPAGGVYRQRRNLPAIRSRGVEADAALAIGRWSLAGSLALIDARVRGGTIAPDLSGRRPAQAPAFAATARIGWDPGRARLRLEARHVSAQYEDDRNARRLAPATTVDATLRLPLAPALAIEAAAENLFDARIETGLSGAAIERGQPRTFWLGLSWTPRRPS